MGEDGEESGGGGGGAAAGDDVCSPHLSLPGRR